MPSRLPEDPLIALERSLMRTTRRLGMLVGAAVAARLKETVEARQSIGETKPVDDDAIDMIRMRGDALTSAAIIGDPMQAMALVKLYEAYRKTVVEIEQLRLARRKQAQAERVAFSKLPPVSDEDVAREVDRVVAERMGRMSGKELYQLASERLAEERRSREIEDREHGDPIALGAGSAGPDDEDD